MSVMFSAKRKREEYMDMEEDVLDTIQNKAVINPNTLDHGAVYQFKNSVEVDSNRLRFLDNCDKSSHLHVSISNLLKNSRSKPITTPFPSEIPPISAYSDIDKENTDYNMTEEFSYIQSEDNLNSMDSSPLMSNVPKDNSSRTIGSAFDIMMNSANEMSSSDIPINLGYNSTLIKPIKFNTFNSFNSNMYNNEERCDVCSRESISICFNCCRAFCGSCITQIYNSNYNHEDSIDICLDCRDNSKFR